MAGYMASVRKAKNYAEFKKKHPNVGLTREGFLDLKRRGRTLSDEDLVKSRKDTQKLRSSSRMDPPLPAKEFLNRNDGGKSEKTTKVY